MNLAQTLAVRELAAGGPGSGRKPGGGENAKTITQHNAARMFHQGMMDKHLRAGDKAGEDPGGHPKQSPHYAAADAHELAMNYHRIASNKLESKLPENKADNKESSQYARGLSQQANAKSAKLGF
jgi:hypothetical protein